MLRIHCAEAIPVIILTLVDQFLLTDIVGYILHTNLPIRTVSINNKIIHIPTCPIPIPQLINYIRHSRAIHNNKLIVNRHLIMLVVILCHLFWRYFQLLFT